MKILPISPIRPIFTKNISKKDDIKIYDRNVLKRQEVNCTYSANIPTQVLIRSKIKLQEGQIYNSAGNALFNRHTTDYFRPDMDWVKFGKYLKEKYNNADKVNTYVWGCSDGSEAYSLSMLLREVFENDCEKFYPIIAKDIDIRTIEKARQEKELGVNISPWNYSCTKDGLDIEDEKAGKYFCRHLEPEYRKLKNKITAPVEFSVGNIVCDIGLMDSNNLSIVMCRNMWPYINPKKYDECAEQLYNQLAKGSIVILGDYDYFGDYDYMCSGDFPYVLKNSGFKLAQSKNTPNDSCCLIFEK